MIKMLSVFFSTAFVLSTLLYPLPARAVSYGNELGLSPFWNWKTIETEHFRLTFPDTLENQTRKAGAFFEEAHQLLAPVMKWEPKTKTQIVLIDNTDQANGLAAPMLRIGIVLLLTPPENWYSTASYDDWLRLLVLHEYTHILNLDVVESFWIPLKWVLGDVIRPNSLWASWMAEGYAVYNETRYTGVGRGRGAFWEMILRSAVEEKKLNDSSWITLDRLNGKSPIYPTGEVRYLFGYHLMNQIAKDPENQKRKFTFDEKTALQGSDSILGEMSSRSGGRIPYFINGNLENITGKDWNTYWDAFVLETETRMSQQLKQIKRQPITTFTRITQEGFRAQGSAFSGDGKWLAFHQETLDQDYQIVLKNLVTGQTQGLGKKISGVGLSFSKDSRFLAYSAIHRSSQYYQTSDLWIYDLEKDTHTQLTQDLRARDPDLSLDGKWIAFTLTENSTTYPALAPLEWKNGIPHLGKIETIRKQKILDRASGPKFSPDSLSIVYSLHRNGNPGEELIQYHLSSNAVSVLVSDGNFNKMPTFDKRGELYFVSDATGVDNLYRYERDLQPKLVTNMTTGLWFPSFSVKNELHANVFSSLGFDLAQVGLNSKVYDPLLATVSEPPAPALLPGTLPSDLSSQKYPTQDYSIFPSIWPRQWAPTLVLGGYNYFGGQVLGFDATFRHQYILAGGYDSYLKKFDGALDYENRMLGPTFKFFTQNYTSAVVGTSDSWEFYARALSVGATVYHPFLSTFSTFTPALGGSFDREYYYFKSSGHQPALATRIIPVLFASLNYSNQDTTRLGIAAESGRRIQLAGASYRISGGVPVYKGLFSDTENFHLGNHWVLSPSVAGAWTSSRNGTPAGNVILRGRSPARRFGFFGFGDPKFTLSEISIRGYPNRTFYTRNVIVGSGELKLPLGRIFRGWSTHPIFFEHLHGFLFGEGYKFPSRDVTSKILTAGGGGLRFDFSIFEYVPLQLSLEYHRGFQKAFGGQGEAFVVLEGVALPI